MSKLQYCPGSTTKLETCPDASKLRICAECPDPTAVCPNGCSSSRTVVVSGYTGICAVYNRTVVLALIGGCLYRENPVVTGMTIGCVDARWYLSYRSTLVWLGDMIYSCPPNGTFTGVPDPFCFMAGNVTFVIS